MLQGLVILADDEQGLKDGEATRGGPVVSSAVGGSLCIFGVSLSLRSHQPWAELLMWPWRLAGAGAMLPHIWSQLPWRGCDRNPPTTHPPTPPPPSTHCCTVQHSFDHSHSYNPPLFITALFIFVLVSSYSLCREQPAPICTEQLENRNNIKNTEGPMWSQCLFCPFWVAVET